MISEALQRPLGPLAAWQWGLVIGGGYLGYRVLTGKGLGIGGGGGGDTIPITPAAIGDPGFTSGGAQGPAGPAGPPGIPGTIITPPTGPHGLHGGPGGIVSVFPGSHLKPHTTTSTTNKASKPISNALPPPPATHPKQYPPPTSTIVHAISPTARV